MDYAVITALSVNTISFAIGASMTWPSPVMKKLIRGGEDSPMIQPITTEEASWITASLNLGAVISPFVYGYLMDKIGRKQTVLWSGIPMLVGYFLMVFNKSIISFFLGRLFIGFSLGGAFNVVPAYLVEISRCHNRGFVSSMLNLFFSSGMMFSYSVGPYISVTSFNLVLLLFPLIFFVSFPIIGKESPYYFIRKGDTSSAKEVLGEIRNYSLNIEEEFKEICRTTGETPNANFSELFGNPMTRKTFAITMSLVFFQQFSGIMAVISCAQNIFEQAGVELDSAICSIIIGGVQVILAFIIPLVIDKFGRKSLLLISSVGMFSSELPLGTFAYFKEKGYDLSSVSLFPLVFIIIYMVTYNIGYGPLPLIVSAEVLPPNVKAATSSISLSFCMLAGFIVAKYFTTITASIGMAAAFFIFAGSCGISILFSFFVMIETKGKTLEQITKELAK